MENANATIEMNAESPLPLIEQVKSALGELRDLGEPVQIEDTALLVPLVEGHSATLSVWVDDPNRVLIQVRFIEALHDDGEAGTLLAAIAGSVGKRFTRRRRAASLLALGALETNFPGRTSAAGYNSDEGEIFVRDLLCPVNGVLVGVKERVRNLVDHAHEIKQFGTTLWSDGFELPGF